MQNIQNQWLGSIHQTENKNNIPWWLKVFQTLVNSIAEDKYLQFTIKPWHPPAMQCLSSNNNIAGIRYSSEISNDNTPDNKAMKKSKCVWTGNFCFWIWKCTCQKKEKCNFVYSANQTSCLTSRNQTTLEEKIDEVYPHHAEAMFIVDITLKEDFPKVGKS
eukprot:12271260-Ditylum_brightwellii.AAC.1